MQLQIFTYKKCSGCGEVKLLQEFNKREDSKDGYRGNCKKCCKQVKAKYHQAHKEKNNQASAQYYQAHKKEITEYLKKYTIQYWKRNKERLKKQHKRYRETHKKEFRQYIAKYLKTSKGKLTTKKKWNKRERELGFNPLNKPFEGSVWHHINNADVIAIPKEIHLKFGGVTREKHRVLILTYYGSIENMLDNLPRGEKFQKFSYANGRR